MIRFSRDAAAGTFLGEVPGAEPSVDQETAAADLAATLALRLEYVLEEDGTSAVLRYVPEDTDTYYIDAVTGEALNMTELEALLGGMGGAAGGDTAAAAETAADSGNGLTEAEQAGIAQLEGVLSSAALDEALRSEAAYGLDGYALSSASYTLVEAREEGEEDQVLCALYYVASGEDYRSRTFTVDARTGPSSPSGPPPPGWRRGRARRSPGSRPRPGPRTTYPGSAAAGGTLWPWRRRRALRRAAGPTTPSPMSASPTASLPGELLRRGHRRHGRICVPPGLRLRRGRDLRQPRGHRGRGRRLWRPGRGPMRPPWPTGWCPGP